MKIFYNSATGNSLYVSKVIKEHFGDCELISMSKALKENKLTYADEAIGFIYPIHCGGLPIVVNEFISRVKINNEAYIFAVGVTGGGEADNSFAQINKILSNKIRNYCTIKYISNYTRMGMNPTEERAKKAIKANEDTLSQFIESLKKKEIKTKEFKTGIMNLGYKLWKDYYKKKDKNFNVNDNCIGCKMCEKVCPVDNIVMESNKPKWNGKCTDCMSCINICPKEAINIGKATIKKNRYFNPYVKKEELL